MFSLKEVAIAHAKAAARLLEPNAEFLNSNEEVIPVFVNLLFQSVEVIIKSLAIESGLADEKELRDRETTRNGHGIRELACLINGKIGADVIVDLLLPKRGYAVSNEMLKIMIFGTEFAPSRNAYASRKITYSQFGAGELQLFGSANDWVKAVMSAAKNIESAISKINRQQA